MQVIVFLEERNDSSTLSSRCGFHVVVEKKKER
jgi:hypothetical protein